MVEKEFRRGFIARLLLFSASQLDGVQGSTTCGNCAANMTFGTALESSKVVKDREQRRQLHLYLSPQILECWPALTVLR